MNPVRYVINKDHNIHEVRGGYPHTCHQFIVRNIHDVLHFYNPCFLTVRSVNKPA